MRRAAVVLLALMALVAMPQAAAGQGDRAEPVVGGGSFNSAPLLEAGRYSDTILPAEGTFYRVELRKGQRLQVRATFDTGEFERNPVRPGFIPGLNTVFYDVTLYTPLRQPIIFDEQETGGSPAAGIQSVSVETKLALGYEQILNGSYTDDEFAGPGTYYVHLTTNDFLTVATIDVEIPTELDVRVTGTAEPSSRDYTPPLIRAGERNEPSERGGEAEIAGLRLGEGRDDESGTGTLLALVAFALLGGLLVGAVAARALRRRAG